MIDFSAYLLIESLRRDQIEAFEEVANGHGYDVPVDLESIIDADSSTDDKIRAKINGQSAERKISKLIKYFYPDLDENNVRQFVTDYQATIAELSDKYVFKLEEATKCYDIGIKSCMTSSKHLTNTYKLLPVKGLILYEDGQPIGRALLWDVESDKYLDRIYPVDNEKIVKMYHEFAKRQQWKYREKQGYDEYYSDSVGLLSIVIDNYENKDINMPYMDTFRYGYIDNDDLIITNDDMDYDFEFDKESGINISSQEEWLDDVVIDDALYVASEDMEENWYLDWEDGTWKSGTWENGHWMDGRWEWGEWKNGTWNTGRWINGFWKDGTWEDGTWEDGTWDNGTWNNGNWKKGWILDHEKKGNYEKDWEWHNNYVMSPISPKEYFNQ